MNKKRIIIISIIAIVLLIGGSFAYWMLNLSQSTTNNIATSCFNISLAENNAINLQNAFPMRDSEGASLTPYEFTITNNCSTYAYYEINLEVLNTTDLGSQFVKVMLDDDSPALLSSRTVTTTTLSNASSSYRLKTAYLHASESKTYNLRLWLDEHVTLEDNVTEKEFSGKITIRATYKPDVPTQMEECEAQYGEGAGACIFIAQADPANNKCLHTDQNGMITDYNTKISDNQSPLVCSMEDDYGTSYYLRGLHTDNNVKFADSCWKIIRTTGTGGIKMIYNGDIDGNGTCTTTSGTHNGFDGQTLSLSGNILYGTSYTKSGSTYTLTGTSTLNWPNNKDLIIGKYTCGDTSSSCSTLYVVSGEANDSLGYVLSLDQSVNYAAIGRSAFNYSGSSAGMPDTGSPAIVGYMYNDRYPVIRRDIGNTGNTIVLRNNASSSNYYYGDTISYSGRMYYITNQDNSDLQQLDWASNYQNNLVGKYTCKGTTTYNSKTLRCNTAYKVLDTTSEANYMITEYLSEGRTNVGAIKLASSYTMSNGNYVLSNPVSISVLDWYNDYSNYDHYYYCENWNDTTCTTLHMLIDVKSSALSDYLVVDQGSYYYGSSFTYNEMNQTRPYTLTNALQIWDVSDRSNINTHHYTCFNESDNTCSELYFIYLKYYNSYYYIKLNGNETINDALDKMLRNDNINVKNSLAKSAIDWWYENNILGTTYESKIEDTIFCNDRTIDDIAGWGETANIYDFPFMKFNGGNNKYYLKCPSKKDAFTVSDTNNGNGALTYPIGFVSAVDTYLSGNITYITTGHSYWLNSPSRFNNYYGDLELAQSNGLIGGNITYGPTDLRVVISLKPGTKFIEGRDGTASNPYEVDMS